MQQIDYAQHPIRLIGLAVSNPVEETDTISHWEQLYLPFADD